ncbi:hypothetical protein DRP05_04010 [Archaeoglobales archaeon]|nr:MAG: hypothetical protein DRP05_04010 [Archaeoglobales archaeon]
MESKIAKALKLKYEPVAILWSDEKPENAIQFKKQRWGCVMWMFARAAKGKTAVFDRETFGCPGGGVGLGFGNQYLNFIGGMEGFCHFLSTGYGQWEGGKDLIERLSGEVGKDRFEKLMYGERYVKSPELVKKFVEQLPIIDIPNRYVIFKPLSKVEEEPKVIVFVANPHQLSALIILANYGRETVDNVVVPMGAGCQQIGIYAYREAKSKNPKAVIGMTDLDARLNVRRQLGDDVFTFAVPYNMFEEMENNVEGSFLEVGTWTKLLKYMG